MPFVEVGQAPNTVLGKEIRVEKSGMRIRFGKCFNKHFPSKSMKVYVDVEGKKIGLKDSGLVKIREEGAHMIVNVSEIKKFKILPKRYPAEWSEKHQMIIAEIEFDV